MERGRHRETKKERKEAMKKPSCVVRIDLVSNQQQPQLRLLRRLSTSAGRARSGTEVQRRKRPDGWMTKEGDWHIGHMQQQSVQILLCPGRVVRSDQMRSLIAERWELGVGSGTR
jgi:hypothetical protein